MASFTQSQLDNLFANSVQVSAPPRYTTIGGKRYLTENGTVYLLEGNKRTPITNEQDLINLERQGIREGVMVNTPYVSPENLPSANNNSTAIIVVAGIIGLILLLKQ